MSHTDSHKPDTHDEHVDDVVIENDYSEDGDVDALAQTDRKLTKLKEKLSQCEQEKEEHLDKLHRAQADFVNTKQRLEKEATEKKTRTENDFIVKLLGVVDSFDMAFADTEAYEQTPQNWRVGVEGIYQQVQSILRDYGVSVFETDGATFDPQKHEALEVVEVSDTEQDNVVQKTIQKGYERNGATIRTAKVAVGEHRDA